MGECCCFSYDPRDWVQEQVRSKELIGEDLEGQEGAFIMDVTLVNNTVRLIWVLPEYTMRELDAKIVEVVGKQRPLYDYRIKKLVKGKINAYLNNRVAPVAWDVTVGEINTNFLGYDQDKTAVVTGPAARVERYVHTKERIKTLLVIIKATNFKCATNFYDGQL